MFPTLSVRLADARPRNLHVLQMVAQYCGVCFQRSDHERVDIDFGTGGAAKLNVPMVAGYDTADIDDLTSRLIDVTGNDGLGTSDFDILAAIFFWISDRANQELPPHSFDAHDRLRGKESVQARMGYPDLPVVNLYCESFCRVLTRQFGFERMPLLPPGKRCAVVISHDVDAPVYPLDPLQDLWTALRSRWDGKKEVSKRYLARGCGRWRELFDRNVRWQWNFRELLEAERLYGVKAMYFFPPTSRFDTDGHEEIDVDYPLDDPRFRSVFRRLVKEGHEIGLHAGYLARDRPGQFLREKSRLELFARQPVQGNRHHLWHMRRDWWSTLEDLAVAGIEFDSSIAFNEMPGYRIGIGFPFKPWNPVADRAIEIVELPTSIMDGAYFYHAGQTVDAVMDHFQKFLDLMKTYQVVTAIDWHVHTAVPSAVGFEAWGTAFCRMLAMLAGDREVWMPTYSEIVSRLKEREQVLSAALQ